MAIRPERASGEDRAIWDIAVVLGVYDNVERIQMLYKPPPPF